MKNLNVLVALLFIIIIKSQLLVSDPGTAAGLASVNGSLMNVNTNLMTIQNNITQMENSLSQEIDKVKRETESIKEIKENEEDSYTQVPSYLQNGNDINTILDKEVEILQSLQNLFSLINNSNAFNNPGELISQLQGFLDQTGSFVDEAINLCTNGVYRLSPNDRQNLLAEIKEEVNSINSMIDSYSVETENYIKSYNRSVDRKEKLNSAINKGIRIN